MNLYAVRYWVPFPSSEYGGLYIFAAHNTEEVVEMARDNTSGYDLNQYGENMFKNMDITPIGITDLFDTPQVVDAFET